MKSDKQEIYNNLSSDVTVRWSVEDEKIPERNNTKERVYNSTSINATWNYTRSSDISSQKPWNQAIIDFIHPEHKNISSIDNFIENIKKCKEEKSPRYPETTISNHDLNDNNISYTKKIFISYSKEDKEELDRFVKHTSSLRERGLIELWMDEYLETKNKWHDEIQSRIEKCDIMVCLVSADFIDTPYIRVHEVKKAIELKKELYAIIIKPCNWDRCDFAGFKVALKGKCITYNEKEDRAKTVVEKDARWNDVIEEMRRIILNDSKY